MKKNFSYPVNEKSVLLQVLFEPDVANHLYETPLSEDQTLTQDQEGKILLRATVKNTSGLQWWLLGFGDTLEVKAPESLRLKLKKIASNMNEKYRQK